MRAGQLSWHKWRILSSMQISAKPWAIFQNDTCACDLQELKTL